MPQRLRAWHGSGLGFSPFAHHYLGYLLRFLFLGVLRCFTSPGCRLFKRLTGCPVKVAPFRDPRVNGCLLLSAAFRSLLRLSSAFSAKAFPSCYVYLNLINPLWTSSKVFYHSIPKFVMVQSLCLSNIMVEMIGIEPTTSCVQSRRSPPELHPQ